MIKIFVIIGCANGVCLPLNRTFETAEACQEVVNDILSTLSTEKPEGLDLNSLAAMCVEKTIAKS